jgi:hypothetical protein
MSEQPHWSYWGNGMPADLSHITEQMAADSRNRRAEVMAKCPPGQYSDVGESSHYKERSERAGIAAALAAAPNVGVHLCEKRTSENHGKPFLTHVLHKHRTKDGDICPGPHRALLLGPEVTP